MASGFGSIASSRAAVKRLICVTVNNTDGTTPDCSGSGGGGGGSGDIEGVTAGTGLSGGGSSGTVTVNYDPSSLSAAAISVTNDTFSFIDVDEIATAVEAIIDEHNAAIINK